MRPDDLSVLSNIQRDTQTCQTIACEIEHDTELRPSSDSPENGYENAIETQSNDRATNETRCAQDYL